MKHEWVYRPSGYYQCLRCNYLLRCKQASLPMNNCVVEEGNPPKPSPILTSSFKPGSLLERCGEMVPTVELNSKAAEGITPERQALLDIQEYIKNYQGSGYYFEDILKIINEVLHD